MVNVEIFYRLHVQQYLMIHEHTADFLFRELSCSEVTSNIFSVTGSHCILTIVWICKIVSVTCKYKKVKTSLPIYVTILQHSLFRPGPGSSRLVVDSFTVVG